MATDMILLREQAVANLLDSLFYLDADNVLSAAGLTRQELTKLMSDDEILHCVNLRMGAILATPIKFTSDSQPALELVERELRPRLKPLREAIFKTVLYGYSVIEAVYKEEAGLVVYDKIQEKPFYWFNVLPNGDLYYLPPNGVGFNHTPILNSPLLIGELTKFPDLKYFLTRNQATYDNPLGVATLSALYWAWFYRNSSWQFRMQFLERHGISQLLGRGADPEALATQLAKAAQDSGIAVGTTDEVSVLQVSSKGEAFQIVEQAILARIQKMLIGRELTGNQEQGSRAAQEVEERLADVLWQADMCLQRDTLQRIVNALVSLNYPGQFVEVVVDVDPGLNIDRAERDKILVESGMVQFTPKYIMENYNLSEDDILVGTPPALAQMQFTGGHNMLAHRLAATTRQQFTPEQKEIETLVDATMAAQAQPLDTKKLREIILSATGPDDLIDKLAAAFDDPAMHNEEFNAVLQQALYIADVFGYGVAE